MMNLIKLKIKAKHLALEPAIIRHEERKLKGKNKLELQNHRKQDVRNEARATQLAIAYIKGKDYSRIESKLKDPDDYKHTLVKKRILAMVKKYHKNSTTEKDISNWMS